MEDKIVVDFDANSESEDAGSEANDELADALREKDQLKRLAKRSQADLVNYRRRIEASRSHPAFEISSESY